MNIERIHSESPGSPAWDHLSNQASPRAEPRQQFLVLRGVSPFLPKASSTRTAQPRIPASAPQTSSNRDFKDQGQNGLGLHQGQCRAAEVRHAVICPSLYRNGLGHMAWWTENQPRAFAKARTLSPELTQASPSLSCEWTGGSQQSLFQTCPLPHRRLSWRSVMVGGCPKFLPQPR